MKTRVDGHSRPFHPSEYCDQRLQSLPITRTELTFRCCALAIEPLALPEPVAEVVPAVVLPVELPAPDVEPVDDELSVPLTSTRLPTFDAERSDEVPSRT
jgi:hypothetical protein